MKQLLLLGLLLAVGPLGCTTTTLLDFTVVSTRSVQLTGNANLERGDNRVEAEMMQRVFIVFPVGELNVRSTIDQAIAVQPGCVALLDGSIKLHERLFFPFLYADSRLVVEGTPLIDPSQVREP